jgi:hypothetical protein
MEDGKQRRIRMVSNDLEKNFPARGVKFHFIIKQNISEKERNSWQEALNSSPLSMWFKQVSFEYSDHPTLISEWQGWNLIKIFCPDAQISMTPSEVKSTYNEIFWEFSEWFTKFCRDRRIECKAYDFRILFRLFPPESFDEFVPIPSLDDISTKVVSPPAFLQNPPTTSETMFDLTHKLLPVNLVKAILKYSEKNKFKVYGGYGLRTEAHANTYELDTVIPSQSEEIESMGSLKGELLHELILQSKEKTPSDFGKVVNVLLTKLLQNAVIDSKKVEHVYNNPSNYVQITQMDKRFVLKFDLRKWSPDSESGKALDVTKKQLQKEFAGTKYYLYGAVSYKLTNEDLPNIEAVIENIIYFRNASRDNLFVNTSILLVDSTYERIIEIARKADEILCSHKIITPGMVTDIEDAKKRWNAAVSDLVREGRSATSFIFVRELFGLPLQMFTGARESLYRELNEIAETHIDTTITSDNMMKSIRYGCYVRA